VAHAKRASVKVTTVEKYHFPVVTVEPFDETKRRRLVFNEAAKQQLLQNYEQVALVNGQENWYLVLPYTVDEARYAADENLPLPPEPELFKWLNVTKQGTVANAKLAEAICGNEGKEFQLVAEVSEEGIPVWKLEEIELVAVL